MSGRFFFLAWLCLSYADLGFAFDPAAVKWQDVKSEVRWLNLYKEPTLLTLAIDGFEAFKKVKPAGYYSPTKFPPGNFTATIKDGRTNQTVEQFNLVVENGKKYLVVTFGNDGLGSRSLVVAENQKSDAGSRVRIFNGCPDTELEFKTADGTLKKIGLGESIDEVIPPGAGFRASCNLISEGKKQEIPIEFPEAESANWLCFVHFDGIDSRVVRVTALQENSRYYRGPEE